MIGVVCGAGSGVVLRRDLPEPVAGPGEVVVEVQLAGICETDLQLARGYLGFRGVLGHEFVGRLGDGRRVTAEINVGCERCAACRAGEGRHCAGRTVLGIVGRDGAMAERVVVPERNLHEIPAGLMDRESVFVEPLAAAYRVVEQVEVEPGQPVAVVGDGKLGLLCAWVLREAGADVTWVGKHPEKLEMAGEGVTTRLVESVGGERRFDLVVEATGSATGLPAALGLVRPMGTIVLKTTIAGRYEIDLAPVVVDEVRVIGSRCGPFQRAIEALATRRHDVGRLIEAEYRLDEAVEAFRAAGRPGARKVLLRVGRE
ncbi:MAG: alcohol dehydrogenase [Isosphaeraceae bacterium]|nr:MAG: alcohol dehydrogenase [Isosphaeraceae bacterium]